MVLLRTSQRQVLRDAPNGERPMDEDQFFPSMKELLITGLNGGTRNVQRMEHKPSEQETDERRCWTYGCFGHVVAECPSRRNAVCSHIKWLERSVMQVLI